MSTRGGARANAGRPTGTLSKLTQKSREEAQAMGLLPHEWLLAIARGDAILQRTHKDVIDRRGKVIKRELVEEEIYPSFEMRQDAAKAAAPYYAPKLATQVITLRGREDLLATMSDEQLDLAIRKLESEVKAENKKANSIKKALKKV